MNFVRGDPFDIFRMAGGRGTKDHKVGLGPLQTGIHVIKHLVIRDPKPVDGVLHPRGLIVTQADDFDARMFRRHLEQIFHVEVVKVNAGNSKFHKGSGQGGDIAKDDGFTNLALPRFSGSGKPDPTGGIPPRTHQEPPC